jgi:methylase of polypeptide subunit release factors
LLRHPAGIVYRSPSRGLIFPSPLCRLAKLEPESLGEVLESPCFDLILANPPYIPSGGVSGLHKYGDGGMRGEEVRCQ